jgi:outer membrane protein assembly factor BamD
MKKSLLISLLLFSAFHFSLFGVEKPGEVALEISVDQRYTMMIDFFQSQKWRRLIEEARLLIQEFPDSPFSKEALYYAGMGYFKTGDYEFANDFFSRYLKDEMTPKFFDQVIRYKFEIAKQFEQGSKRHVFGWEKMPTWLPAYDAAIEIYDEVITTLPRDDLAAESLYRKAVLLLKIETYQKSVEAFQTLIRRFPKHPLASDGYLGVAEVYLTRCKKEFPDTDLLDLAEINLRKFRSHFPGESRLEIAQKKLLEMKEKLAEDLFEMGAFYERTKKKNAASLYYSMILKKYPETKTARRSRGRLRRLDIPLKQMQTEKPAIIVDTEHATSDISSPQ